MKGVDTCLCNTHEGRAAECARAIPSEGVCPCVCHMAYADAPDPIEGYKHKPLRAGNPTKEKKKTPAFPGMEDGIKKAPRTKKTKAAG